MSNSSFVILCGFLSLLAMGPVVNAQHPSLYDCPGPNVPSHDHQRLLEHAIFAEVAYEATGTHSVDMNKYCPHRTYRQSKKKELVVREIPRQIIDRAIQKFAEEGLEDEFYTEVDSGETFVVCNSRESLGQRLVIGLRYILGDGQLTLIPRIVLAGTLMLTGEEELRIIELQYESDPDNSQSYQGGKIFGVQGTDIFRHRQLGSAVRALTDSSRCFEFALEIAKAFFNSCDKDLMSLLYHDNISASDNSRNNTIVGHSLGGAVAQYVSQSRDFSSLVRECNQRNTYQMYSFNSFGVSSTMQTVASTMEKTYSVRIAGELLEQLETDLGRKQIGHTYRYAVPPPSDIAGRIYRHRIRTARKEICGCRDSARHESILSYEYVEPASQVESQE